MRKLLVGAGVVLVLATAVVVVAAVSLNRIIAENRDRLVQRAEAAVGRPLSVDRITLDLWGGLGVRLENVRIAEDPRFDHTDFVQAKAFTARPRLWPLLRGELEVQRVDATQPQIHLVRNADGMWNYTTLGMRRVPTETGAGPPDAEPSSGAPPELPWLLGLVKISDGTIVVSDRASQPPRDVQITAIDLRVRNVSRSRAMTFDLAAAVQSDQSNVSVHGSVGPLSTKDPIPLVLAGDFGPFGPHKLRIHDVEVEGEISPDLVRATRLEGQAFGGGFNYAAAFPLRDSGNASLKGKLTGAALAQVAELFRATKQIDGTGDVSLDLHATGGSAERIRSTLSGNASLTVHDGALRNFNLANDVLGRATGIATIGSLISANVKPKYARVFAAKDTRFDALRATFTVADQRLHTNDCVLETSDYGAAVRGSIGFNRDADLSGTLALSKPFSADVVADVKEAKYLLERDGRLTVPFRLRGKLGEAKPELDSSYVVEALTRALSRGSAGNLLEKLLGGKPRNPQAPEERGRPLQDRLRDLFGR